MKGFAWVAMGAVLMTPSVMADTPVSMNEECQLQAEVYQLVGIRRDEGMSASEIFGGWKDLDVDDSVARFVTKAIEIVYYGPGNTLTPEQLYAAGYMGCMNYRIE